MSHTFGPETAKIIDAYLAFVKKRLETTNFRAEAKLKRIEALGDAIFAARKSFLESRSDSLENRPKPVLGKGQ